MPRLHQRPILSFQPVTVLVVSHVRETVRKLELTKLVIFVLIENNGCVSASMYTGQQNKVHLIARGIINITLLFAF